VLLVERTGGGVVVGTSEPLAASAAVAVPVPVALFFRFPLERRVRRSPPERPFALLLLLPLPLPLSSSMFLTPEDEHKSKDVLHPSFGRPPTSNDSNDKLL
jgi:hypothetical protein